MTAYNKDTKDLRRVPFKVPDGYFEQVAVKVMAELPDYPEAPKAELNRSLFQRMKPYLYLAAMFAGIWCMMKVFTMVGDSSYSLDNPPESVVLAMNDPDTYEFYTGQYGDCVLMSDPTGDFDIQEAILPSDGSTEALEKEFGIELDPNYENIKVF
ncbi:MAG: hypothetical protein NC328_05600 [Muribaculum sp.]|nr:hypothetical protein [Muribaculum sp.]